MRETRRRRRSAGAHEGDTRERKGDRREIVIDKKQRALAFVYEGLGDRERQSATAPQRRSTRAP